MLLFDDISENWKSVVDYVMQAIETMEFDNGLRTGVLVGGFWCLCGNCTYPRINFKPPGGAGWF